MPSLLSKDYCDRTFYRVTWWDKHPDRVPHDYCHGFCDHPAPTMQTVDSDDSWLDEAVVW